MLAVLLCGAAGAAAQVRAQVPGQATGEEVDWLKIVPGDARFYVELHDLAGIRRQFQALGIWRTVRELSERDPAGATTQPWQRRTAELLGLSPEAAITFLLGRRAALIAASSAQWQDGVLLAELPRASDLDPLLRRWRARPLPPEGKVRRYVLSGRMMLAVRHRTLVFGPADDPEGLWNRTVLLLSGRRGPTLGGRSEFAGLRSRLSKDYRGLCYAVWPKADPTAVRGCRRLLVGVSVASAGIVCELRGYRDSDERIAPCLSASVIGALPADSLAVWTGGFAFSEFETRLTSDQRRDGGLLVPLFIGAFAGIAGGSDDLLGKLGPGYAVVVGKDRPALSAGLDLPAVTILIEAREPETHLERLDLVISFLAQLTSWLTTPQDGEPMSVQVIKTQCEDVELHHVEMGPALARRTGLSFLDGVEPCWAVLDGRVIVSTSLRHVERLVRAARGKALRLDGAPGVKSLLPHEDGGEAVAEWFLLRGSLVSRMWSSWLHFVRRRYPEAMSKGWWQAWATDRLERRTRLGIGLVRDEADARRAIVRELRPGSPAAGVLRVGDVIVGAAGKPLTTTQPAREVADRYGARGGARVFRLDVLRRGKPLTLKIPVLPPGATDLSDFDPAGALRQLIILSRRAETVTVWRYATSPDRFDARIVIRWERSD